MSYIDLVILILADAGAITQEIGGSHAPKPT
jgi:hypothetical protein